MLVLLWTVEQIRVQILGIDGDRANQAFSNCWLLVNRTVFQRLAANKSNNGHFQRDVGFDTRTPMELFV